MSIIFDTSVWIEYLKANEEYFDPCQKLLERREVLGLEIIFAELLQGALNKREVDVIQDFYRALPKVREDELILKAGEYSREHKLMSKGVGLIDAIIITTTMVTNSQLWTLDKRVRAHIPDERLYEPG